MNACCRTLAGYHIFACADAVPGPLDLQVTINRDHVAVAALVGGTRPVLMLNGLLSELAVSTERIFPSLSFGMRATVELSDGAAHELHAWLQQVAP